MKINYKVLWVEDNKSWYSTTNDMFYDYMYDLGFILDSKRVESLAEVRNEASISGLAEYDLLLVDFTLKGEGNGNEVITFIRDFDENQILTEVLFYSSDIENVRDSMREHSLEGVYSADRRDIEIKFQRLVATTIKKIQDVNAIRGLIMAETSELDHLMLSIVRAKIEKGTEKSRILSDYIISSISEFNKNNETRLKKLVDENDVIGIITSPLYHSMAKAKSIHKLIKLLNDTGLSDLDNFTADYDKHVISVRNNFAHVTEEIDETGKKKLVSQINGREVVFTSEECVNIRKKLIHYSDRLGELAKIVVIN